MASSSHFFLQISTCSMQNWGGGGRLGRGKGGFFLHTPASRPLLHTKVFSRLGSPGLASRPRPTPAHAGPDHQQTPRAARPAERGARRGSGRERRWGLPKTGTESGRLGRVERQAEAGKERRTRQAARRAPDGPDHGPGLGGEAAGGGGSGEDERGRGSASAAARPSAEQPAEAEAAPSPSPPPPRGPRSENETGEQAPSPGRAR